MDFGLAIHRLLTRQMPEDLYYRVPSSGAVPHAGDVTFRWMGAAGFEIEAAGRRMLIDPFVSRPSIRETLLHPLVPDTDAVRRYVESADVICAGHSHHDHAMDIGAICAHTGATVYGSESALHAALTTGAPRDLLSHIAAGDVVEHAPFRIRVLRSVHGKVFAGRIPSPGVMGDPAGPHRIRQYKVGATFGLHVTVGDLSFFHLGSADFVEAALHGVRCDVLLLCIVGRQGSPNFTHRILRALRPKVVLPCHWDNFFLPFDHPARVIPRCDVEGFLEEVATSGVDCEVALLDYFSSYRYRAQG